MLEQGRVGAAILGGGAVEPVEVVTHDDVVWTYPADELVVRLPEPHAPLAFPEALLALSAGGHRVERAVLAELDVEEEEEGRGRGKRKDRSVLRMGRLTAPPQIVATTLPQGRRSCAHDTCQRGGCVSNGIETGGLDVHVRATTYPSRRFGQGRCIASGSLRGSSPGIAPDPIGQPRPAFPLRDAPRAIGALRPVRPGPRGRSRLRLVVARRSPIPELLAGSTSGSIMKILKISILALALSALTMQPALAQAPEQCPNGRSPSGAMWLSILHPGLGEYFLNEWGSWTRNMPKKKFWLGFIPFYGWPGYLQVKSAIDARNCRTNDDLKF